MNIIRSTLIFLVLQFYAAQAQQTAAITNDLAGKSIEELRQIARGLGEGKSSKEFVDAAYASGRDDFVALCWSINTTSSWCGDRVEKSQDPVFRDKQVLMMLRNGGPNSGWPDGGGGLYGGSQIGIMTTLRRWLWNYIPLSDDDYSLIDSPEKRLVFADKLEALMKAKHEPAQVPKAVPSPPPTATSPPPTPKQAPAAVVPKAPAPSSATSPVAAPTPLEAPAKSLPWAWISATAALLLIIALRFLRRKS